MLKENCMKVEIVKESADFTRHISCIIYIDEIEKIVLSDPDKRNLNVYNTHDFTLFYKV